MSEIEKLQQTQNLALYDGFIVACSFTLYLLFNIFGMDRAASSCGILIGMWAALFLGRLLIRPK